MVLHTPFDELQRVTTSKKSTLVDKKKQEGSSLKTLYQGTFLFETRSNINLLIFVLFYVKEETFNYLQLLSTNRRALFYFDYNTNS